jgi:diguanylate cyclase (GGDEF)-like protein
MQRFKHDRPTIGILAGWSPHEGGIPHRYLSTVVLGLQSAALTRQCHLLIGWGVGRVDTANYPAWPEISPEVDFVPVGPWNTDGLIVFAPLRSPDRSRYLQNLMSEGHPVLFIAPGENGPTISVNNQQGIRQAISHFVEHGHRQIAFIAGTPGEMGDTESRLAAFQTAMAENGLDVDPRLVAWGWHREFEGYKAMSDIIATGVPFTAVMASNDNCAIGAMRAMREAGLKIPQDAAIIGFDDQPDAMAQVPALTSVHVPLTMIGEQALVSMADHLTEKLPLESVQIATRLTPRQSCGCIPAVIASAVNNKRRSQRSSLAWLETPAISFSEKVEHIVNEMLAGLPSKLRFPHGKQIHDICTSLVEEFYRTLTEADLINFPAALMEAVYQFEKTGGGSDLWQEMISVLRREMVALPADWAQAHTRLVAENLLHQARTAISESMQRQKYQHQYQRDIAVQSLSVLTAQLSAALEEKRVVELLNSHVAALGIRHVRVALFETGNENPVEWSIALNPTDDLGNPRFASTDFPPLGMYPPDELLNLALLPLVFQNEALGYVAFDATDLGPCAVIARQLAATFKTARLHAQVVELSLTDALTGLANRRYFDIFLKNEVSRSQRFGRNLALILVDVDHFKQYNDTYGHQGGDLALQQVAACLSADRRTIDIVARIGGDEFVIILPETEVIGALEVTRRIRARIEHTPGFKRLLSVSIGLTSAVGVDAETMLSQADMALYESKRLGRSQTHIFQSGQVFDEAQFPVQEQRVETNFNATLVRQLSRVV